MNQPRKAVEATKNQAAITSYHLQRDGDQPAGTNTQNHTEIERGNLPKLENEVGDKRSVLSQMKRSGDKDISPTTTFGTHKRSKTDHKMDTRVFHF